LMSRCRMLCALRCTSARATCAAIRAPSCARSHGVWQVAANRPGSGTCAMQLHASASSTCLRAAVTRAADRPAACARLHTPAAPPPLSPS
jgi:hypothetical protein